MPRPANTTRTGDPRGSARPFDPDDPGPYPGPFRDPWWQPDRRVGRHRAGRLPDPLGSRRRAGRLVVDLLLLPLHLLFALGLRLARRPKPRHRAGRASAMEDWADQTVAWLGLVRELGEADAAARAVPRPRPYPARI